MANIKNNVAGQETCRKILEAAGQVFAERGLHAATLQEITDRAGVNKAAVNYHFHDKNELYAAVVKYAITCSAMDPTPQELEGNPKTASALSSTTPFNTFSTPTAPPGEPPS